MPEQQIPPQQQILQPQQMPQQQMAPQQPAKQIIVEKEQVSPVKSFLRLLVSVIIIVCVAALCYGVWWLIKYSLAQGWL